MEHLTPEQLYAGLDNIRDSPLDGGRVHLLVRRPAENAREVLGQAEIRIATGLEGDNWQFENANPNEPVDREAQITLMNSRTIQLISGAVERWPLAGDQLYVDMNLGHENLPPGTLLQIGTCILRVSEKPHRGCKKFAERYGVDAMRFVNSEVGRELNLRGINASVVKEGTVRVDDLVKILVES